MHSPWGPSPAFRRRDPMDLRSLRDHWFTKPLFLALQWIA